MMFPIVPLYGFLAKIPLLRYIHDDEKVILLFSALVVVAGIATINDGMTKHGEGKTIEGRGNVRQGFLVILVGVAFLLTGSYVVALILAAVALGLLVIVGWILLELFRWLRRAVTIAFSSSGSKSG